MSIEALRLLVDKFEECGIHRVDSHKLGELISDMDDMLTSAMLFFLIRGGFEAEGVMWNTLWQSVSGRTVIAWILLIK